MHGYYQSFEIIAKFKYILTCEDEGKEIKRLIKEKIVLSSRLKTKLKNNGCIKLNGIPAAGYMKPKQGDLLTVEFPDEISHFEPENIPINVIYEDEDLLIINKQPGIVVHPTKGQPAHTMVNGIMKYMLDTDQRFKIRLINRLDMYTSGVLLVAKNAFAQEEISKQMRNDLTRKEYLCAVHGDFESDEGEINLPIGRPSADDVTRAVMEKGKPSLTKYRVIKKFQYGSRKISLLRVRLMTGRTHQIRVHMSHIGHPVVGDDLYGGEFPMLIERQALHSASFAFLHPIKKQKMEVHAPAPPDIERLCSSCSEV